MELEGSGLGGPSRFVALHIAPVQAEGVTIDTAVVTVIDSTDLVQTRRRLESVEAEHQDGFLGGKDAVGRSLEEVCGAVPALRPVLEGARKAFTQNKRWVSGRKGVTAPGSRPPGQFVCTAVPTHGVGGRVTGVVLYGLDVAEGGERTV